MLTLTGIDREQVTFSNLKSQIASDNEIRLIDAFVEEYISTVRGAKECNLTGEVINFIPYSVQTLLF